MTTERDVLDRLHVRYSAVSQGTSIRYAVAEHVRNAAGFWASRTLDFIALDLWESSGLALHGHEVKTSRSDLRRELADPEKARAFLPYCDRFWLVVPDRKIIDGIDLPHEWGVMLAPDVHPSAQLPATARVHRPAPPLTPGPLPKSFVASLARSIQKTNHRALAHLGGTS